MRKAFAVLFRVAALAGTFGVFPEVQAVQIPAPPVSGFAEDIQVRFDPRLQQTQVTGRASPDQCFSLTLPREWQATAGGMETHLRSAFSEAELTVNLRSSQELRGLPQADLTSRDAARLQQDYENLLGRPAQSVSLASLTQQATRWSATWIDANLLSGPMTVEAFIVPLSGEWVLELSFANVPAKEEYEALARGLLSGLELKRGIGCGNRLAF